ncbi:MAG: chemotaxis protein CheW [Gemmatimonadaceae bacterium]
MNSVTYTSTSIRAGAAGSRDALLVRIGREFVAVWLDSVVSQTEDVEIRPLPDWRTGVAGLMRAGDHFVPLYRPEETLGIARDDATRERCAIVVRAGGTSIALAVDEPLDVLTIDRASLRPPPAAIAEDGLVQALTWSDGVLVSVLDAAALVASCQSAAPVNVERRQ